MIVNNFVIFAVKVLLHQKLQTCVGLLSVEFFLVTMLCNELMETCSKRLHLRSIGASISIVFWPL